jgi:cytochrome b involved in lipid metabolism
VSYKDKDKLYDITNFVRNHPGEKDKIICKAIDNSYNSQPKNKEDIWNLRGINNNSWHSINLL